MNRGDFIDFPCIGTAEDEAVVYISFDGADEGLGDAVGGGAGVTGLKAVEAVGYRHSSLLHGADKGVQKGSAGHVDRALHDGDVLFFGLYIHIFESFRCVALFGGYETGSHLHAGEAQGEVMLNILFIENAAAEDDGDFLMEFFFKFFDHVEDFPDFFS